MDDFTVKSVADAPPPSATGREPGKTKYPWHDMTSPGDVFCAGTYTHALRSSIIASGKRWFERHRPHLTIVTRKEKDPDDSTVDLLYVWAAEANPEEE